MHEPFDPEPTQELSAEETPTPLWLTGLGVALFVGAALVWFIGRSASAEAEPGESGTPSAAASTAASGEAPGPLERRR